LLPIIVRVDMEQPLTRAALNSDDLEGNVIWGRQPIGYRSVFRAVMVYWSGLGKRIQPAC